MSGIKDQAQMDEMRRRLYERGATPEPHTRHDLTDEPVSVPRAWPNVMPSNTAFANPADPRPEALVTPELTVHDSKNTKQGLSHRYRWIIILASLAFFLLVLGATSLYLLMGTNQISNKNIGITITGPLTIGGGEVMPLQISVINDNKVPIESAVLIVNYPPGTKSAEENPKDLFEERISIERINAGEAFNVPVRAVMFGEENQEREIRATIEYRLVDSNGTFYKESEPLLFKITSSPLVIKVDSLKKVSAGQEIEVTLTVQSNSPTPLKNILIAANYPSNFDYTSASPDPTYRESEWIIKEIQPEQSATIKIKGTIVGNQNEEFQMQFSAGTPRQDNQFIIGSVLANASADFVIEKPFIDVGININGLESEIVTLKTGNQTSVNIQVRNTLTETLYDMAVEVLIAGNILVREDVSVSRGYYDSVKDVIRFEVSGDDTLAQVSPGETRKFSFSIKPGNQTQTPSFNVTANAYARRVNETRAIEQLVGTAKSEVKFTSSVSVARQVGRGTAGFTESGPVPPVADQATTYTVTLQAGAGGNDVTGATLVTSLPQYVSWENHSSGDGNMEFNPISKELTWTIGTIEAEKTKQVSFQISLLPSQNQIGTTPALLGVQRLRATDRFTGDVVRAEGVPVSAELAQEAGFAKGNGSVVRSTSEDDN